MVTFCVFALNNTNICHSGYKLIVWYYHMKGKSFFFKKNLIISICILGYPLIPDFFLDVDPDTIAMKMEAQGKEITLSLSLASPGLKKGKWRGGGGSCSPSSFPSFSRSILERILELCKTCKICKTGKNGSVLSRLVIGQTHMDTSQWLDSRITINHNVACLVFILGYCASLVCRI